MRPPDRDIIARAEHAQGSPPWDSEFPRQRVGVDDGARNRGLDTRAHAFQFQKTPIEVADIMSNDHSIFDQLGNSTDMSLERTRAPDILFRDSVNPRGRSWYATARVDQ
tara:strand:+ start:2590 stop:2916 length:327 start_codon:yes stop_codon:yes gene_type:complete